MHSIALPKKIDFEKGHEPNRGLAMVEPLFPGYGITLGNSIRRVLLSSLPGAAVIGVKIEGASHEFMTLPHLKEDILEFILNLKQLNLKVHSEEVVRLELEVHGVKDIKASDIKKDSNVEIANPDLVLGHITDMAGSLKAEVFVSQGMGYEMIESREAKENEIGYIEMDSIFSPILSVGITVKNVRVGKMTNWDKLVLDITTDGTITPEEAFKKSVAILIEQYNALLTPPVEEKEEEQIKEPENAMDARDTETPVEKEIPEEEKPAEDKAKRKRGRPKKS